MTNLSFAESLFGFRVDRNKMAAVVVAPRSRLRPRLVHVTQVDVAAEEEVFHHIITLHSK